MKNKLAGLAIVFFCCIACRTKKETPEPVSQPVEKLPGFTAVTVRDFKGLDGCSFLLEMNDSIRFEPVDFADSLKKDSLALWIRYVPVKDHLSICMSGRAIKLTEARYRKQ